VAVEIGQSAGICQINLIENKINFLGWLVLIFEYGNNGVLTNL
jgi:hypothetical protein